MYSIQERLGIHTESISGAQWQLLCGLRCAMPGIVVSFDPVKQTCVIQPAIQELVVPLNADQSASSAPPVWTTIDPLEDVPVIMQRAGGYSITFPIVPGTECLLIFADSCIDGWWQSGGVQPQFDRRRHDLSDAFALFGPWSQPNVLENYSTTSMQHRSDDGSVVIDLAPGVVTFIAPQVKVTSPAITLAAEGGTAMPLATSALVDWLTTSVLPFLESKGYVGPPPPDDSVTTVVMGE